MKHTVQHQPQWQIPFFTIWSGQLSAISIHEEDYNDKETL